MNSSCLIDIQRMTTAKTEEEFFDVVSTDKKKSKVWRRYSMMDPFLMTMIYLWWILPTSGLPVVLPT